MTKLLTPDIFNECIERAGSIVILGHVSPDGDSIGSVLGIYNYILRLKGPDYTRAAVYLDDPSDKFSYLKGFDRIRLEPDDSSYELAIICDAADTERMGRFAGYYKTADISVLIDHHATNTGFGDYALIEGEASSASEVVFGLMKEPYIDRDVAECIYTGIVHDTGVFRYSSTHPSTMRIAGECMARGVDFTRIIEETYFDMSYTEQKVLGYLLSHMASRLDGRMVYAAVDRATLKALGDEDADLDGMIDKLRSTSGVLMAVFLYETRSGRVKASLRSNTDAVDVSAMALRYGGGGHKRAAGCFMSPDLDSDIEELTELLKTDLTKADLL